MLTSIVFLLPYLLGLTNKVSFLLSFVLLTILEPVLFGQVYLWTSGFYNYIPPIWISMLVLTLIHVYPSVKNRFLKHLVCLGVFLLGFCAQLYVEHTTIINVILSFSLLVYSTVSRNRNRLIPCLLWFCSALLGTITMFAIPALFAPKGNRSEGYRSYNLNSISTLITSIIKNGMWLSNYYSGVNSLPLCIGAASTVFLVQHRYKTKNYTVLLLLSFICGGVLLISDMTSTNRWFGEPAILYHCFLTALVITLYIIWLFAAVKLPHGSTRNKTVFLLFLAFMSLAPLLVVSPVRERVTYQSYILFCAASIVCVSRVLDDYRCILPHVKKALTVISICIAINISFTMLNVNNIANIREAYIYQELQKGSTEITIFKLPYDYIDWDSTWSLNYYYYQEKPHDTHFIIIDYVDWKNDYLPVFMNANK